MSYNIVLNIKLIPNALFIMSWSSVPYFRNTII